MTEETETLGKDMRTEYRLEGCPHPLVLLSDGQMHGPLGTPEQLRDFVEPYAHLTRDGRIMRHGKQIGVRADLIPTGNEIALLPVNRERMRAVLEAFLSGRVMPGWTVNL